MKKRNDDHTEVLKTGTCPTLSGKSKLTYSIGRNEKGDALRIDANDGGGFFNQEWIQLSAITRVLDTSKPFASNVLAQLFEGRSVNSSPFLAGVLLHLGLLKRAQDPRLFMRGDVKDLGAEKPKTTKKPSKK